ncbi:MAG: hypothetical protein K8R91_00590 [Phycisphaerae bacterium]|nr:hypothetical protein [Phycisphaerae bacterium]
MEESLGIATSIGVSFDRSGQLISAARQVEIRDEGYGIKKYIGDIGIWDTNNGELATCVDLVCFRGNRWGPSLLGTSLDPDGDRYVDYDDLGYSISAVEGGYVSISLVDSIGARKEKTIGRIEFEENGERMAISYQEGCIEVRDGPPFLRLGSCDSETREPIVDLDFSYSGDQLAQIRMDEITLWDLGRLRGTLSLSIRLNDATHLEFANTDDFLLVSSSDTITILESKEGQLVHEFQTPDITTFTISPDDRLLIWGDKNGMIHIIGSPLNDDG